MSQARPAAGPRAVQTHSEAVEQFRRPFAPGAIGFRIIRQLAAGDDRSGAVVVAPYVRAQSVIVRLNSIVPGRWVQRFDEFQLDLNQIGGGARLFLICRLTVTLPREAGGPDVDVPYEDVGEADTTVHHPVKALYSDARKRAAAAAGIGTYLITVVPETTLPINSGDVAIAADGEPVLTGSAVRRLREQYRHQIDRPAIRSEFGETLGHGEPDDGPADPDRVGTARAALPARLPEASPLQPEEPERDGPQDVALTGWGDSRPTPPPAPIALARDVARSEPAARPAPALPTSAAMSADHVEEVCLEAQRAGVSSSRLATIVLGLSGRPPVGEQAAAREFDSGLLNRTLDRLVPQILAAVRARGGAPADSSTPSAGGAADGTVPLDFGALSDDGT